MYMDVQENQNTSFKLDFSFIWIFSSFETGFGCQVDEKMELH